MRKLAVWRLRSTWIDGPKVICYAGATRHGEEHWHSWPHTNWRKRVQTRSRIPWFRLAYPGEPREVHGRGKHSRNPLFEFEFFICKGTANKIFNKFFEGVRSSKLQSGHFCALFEVPVFLWKTLILSIFSTLINRHESGIINYRDTDQMIECRPRSVSKSDPVKADFSS